MTTSAPALATTLLPLSEIIARAPEGQELVPGFVGYWQGRRYDVTAVLDRTATLAVPDAPHVDKLLKRHDQILVDPAVVTWRPAPPKPRRPWMAHDDADVRAARKSYLTEERTGRYAARARGAHDRQRPSARDSWSVCSRDGCGKPIHPNNRRDECKQCQVTCPTCGGRKSDRSAACQRCLMPVRAPRRPAPERRAAPSIDLAPLVAELRAIAARLQEIAGELGGEAPC